MTKINITTTNIFEINTRNILAKNNIISIGVPHEEWRNPLNFNRTTLTNKVAIIDELAVIYDTFSTNLDESYSISLGNFLLIARNIDIWVNGDNLIQTFIKLDKKLLEQVKKKRGIDKVQDLISKGANVNAENLYKRTALIIASRFANLDKVKLLVDNGANVHAKDFYKRTTLIEACYGGKLDKVKYLVEQGVDINHKDSYGATALRIAKSYKFNDIEQYLLEQGAVNNGK